MRPEIETARHEIKLLRHDIEMVKKDLILKLGAITVTGFIATTGIILGAMSLMLN